MTDLEEKQQRLRILSLQLAIDFSKHKELDGSVRSKAEKFYNYITLGDVNDEENVK